MQRPPHEIDAFFDRILNVRAHRLHGLELVSWSPGQSTLAFTAGEESLGPTDSVHGGVVSLLLEPTALFALFPMLPADRYAVTADIHVQLLRPVRPHARVTLEGRVLRVGSQLAFCEASARDDGRLCASARLTKAIVAAPSV